MPAEKQPFYDPVPPTYDEALAGGSRRTDVRATSSRSTVDERNATAAESENLLRQSQGAASSSRRPNRYRPPTVETNDEESSWGSSSDDDSDSDETDHVRREIEEMDVEVSDRSRNSTWHKRIPFRLNLSKWNWSWRPSLPRFRIRLPSRPDTSEPATSNIEDGGEQNQLITPRFRWPKVNGMFLIITFARLLALFTVLGFLFFLFSSGVLSGLNTPLSSGRRFNPEDLRKHVQTNVDPQRMRAAVNHFASYAHIAGTEGDYATAMDVESMFSRAGLEEVRLDEYYVYLNYPKKDGRSVQIMDKAGKRAIWTAKLEEEERHTETAGRQTFVFHGHSKSGDVQGPLIYANYGSRTDFRKLRDSGIDTKGAIALVRYYGSQGDRALKVKAAELAGFAGCIIYSDPADDGFLKGEVAPSGRYMPSDGVQRGSVSLMSWVVGDVLTPGWESKKDLPRMKVDESPGLVRIPSLPLAWRDAQVLLQHLKGHGQRVSDDWKGGVPEVTEWWTGNSTSPIIRLKNEQDEIEKQPIWNVYGKIVGMEQTAKSIILGNHRDAWAFGATDPHSGTAIMIELARIFGNLLDLGWRPLRTIEFMSWDAEEYNLIGSTEYVENNLKALREDGYAYINLDTVVTGSEFHAAGSPVFQKTLLHALDRVMDPYKNATLRELWHRRNGQLGGLGAGSDYVAFQDIAGTSSIDLEFRGHEFPLHSSYDNFELVDKVLDPDFTYHRMMGEVVGLLLLDLADRAILPFDMSSYGTQLEAWTGDLKKWSIEKSGHDRSRSLPFQELEEAVAMIKSNAVEFEKWEMQWDQSVRASGGWESNDIAVIRDEYNDRMAQFETALLDLELGGGIPNRTQFKHVVFGPQLWSGYDEAFFPAIRDSIEAHDWELAKQVTKKTAALMRAAAGLLKL